MYGARLHQMDVRLTKEFKVQRTSVQGQFDIYNLCNGNTTLAQNNTYGVSWQIPTTFLGARTAKFGVLMKF